MEGYAAVFKIALSLMSVHEEILLASDSFESVTGVLKQTLPDMSPSDMELVFQKVSVCMLLHLWEELYLANKSSVGAGGHRIPIHTEMELNEKWAIKWARGKFEWSLCITLETTYVVYSQTDSPRLLWSFNTRWDVHFAST